MNYSSLETIRRKVSKLAKVIDAPKDLIPTFGHSIDFGTPNIEADGDGYHFVVEERGQVLEKRTTADIDELLYWIFESITFSMASDYELRNRLPDVDSRRLLFERQLELLDRVKHGFTGKKESEIKDVLREHPYEDNK
jgi:hypothetical protein